MEYLDLINRLFVILICLFSMMLGIWVYRANSKLKVNRIFLVMTIAFVGWVGLAYLTDIFTNELIILWSMKLAYASVIISVVSIYFFSVYFPGELPKSLYLSIANKAVIVAGSLVLLFSIFGDFLISGFYTTGQVHNPIFGPLEHVLYFSIVAMTILLMINFFKQYFTIPKQDKTKLAYFLIGLVIFIVSNLIFNILLPIVMGNLAYYQLGSYSVIFFLGFTAYAIAKHSLFGIRAILAGLLVGILAILLFLDAVVLTQEPFLQIIKWVILAVFLFFGYYLVRSVLKEVQLRKSLQHAYADLKQLDTAKSEFISVASHQLRTPLSAIKGYVSMMRKGDYGDVSPDMAEALAVLHESNERLVVLVNNMLNISRIESGRLQFKPRAMAIEPIIANTVNELTPEANGAGVRLIYRKPPAPAREIFADPGLVHEILINLVDNGIKYTQRGGEVVVSLRPAERFLRTEIKDSGIGVVPETVPALFKKFSRGQSGAKMHTNGAGLGLYIVKELVNLHKGQVGVTSAGSGKGSTFWFELPYDIM